MFLFPICIIQKVTILAPKSGRTFMVIGNQMQNHKIETNSGHIYMKMEVFEPLKFLSKL